MKPVITVLFIVACLMALPATYAQVNDANAAAQQAAAMTGGRVVDVQLSGNDGGGVYIVKVLMPDGRVKVVTVPATTSEH